MYFIGVMREQDKRYKFVTRNWGIYNDDFTEDLNKARYFRRKSDVLQSWPYKILMSLPEHKCTVLYYDLNKIRYYTIIEQNTGSEIYKPNC